MAAGNSTDTCAHDDSGGGGLGEVLAGVAIAVVASVGINIGNNIQARTCTLCAWTSPPAASGLRLGGHGVGVGVRLRLRLRVRVRVRARLRVRARSRG